MDDIDEKVLSIVQPQMEPLKNIYDSDSKFEDNEPSVQIEKQIENPSSSAFEDNLEYIYIVSDDGHENFASTSAPTTAEKELPFKENLVTTPSKQDKENNFNIASMDCSIYKK
ncbi:uncharacterized protein LOC111692076 [Anoplophora glabripennis]|uniref:uncharacterized protein LOC111692076 n=1 Tax=Anoplophora glabripennis TaxID=217634 RepID=UPI000C75BB8D|nr:uncharacterized protein LOC111692076 [Anoplophora glabripennis]